MTLKPGTVVVLRGLTRKPKGSKDTLPLTIAKVAKVNGWRLKIKLRTGGWPIRFAPKGRECDAAQVVRVATEREVALGIVMGGVSLFVDRSRGGLSNRSM